MLTVINRIVLKFRKKKEKNLRRICHLITTTDKIKQNRLKSFFCDETSKQEIVIFLRLLHIMSILF